MEDTNGKTNQSGSEKKRHSSNTVKNADKFTIVQEELARRFGASFEHSDLISQAVRKLKAPELRRP
eukprot:1927273-Ditylum_brightwellii.AAC.1